MHAAQDEKHEFGLWSVHTGDPRNDYRTAEGTWQLSTDALPATVQQHQATQRTLEVLQNFENKIRELDQKQGLSKEEIDHKIEEFKERNQENDQSASETKKE